MLPGETVPVDGVITAGQTSIDQAVMTGESLPVDKAPGDEVSSGTVNQFGAFEMRASKVGEDSSIQRMIRLVQSADAGKAKIVGLADRWTVERCVCSAPVPWCWPPPRPLWRPLATPPATVSWCGRGTPLERLSRVKAGGLRQNRHPHPTAPRRVVAVEAASPFDRETVYRLAAGGGTALRAPPLGKAIARCWGKEHGQPLPQPRRLYHAPPAGG